MANQEHLAILKKGVGEWNEWRRKNSAILPDLSGANLSKMELSGADLTMTNLSRANLIDAVLMEANLTRAYLSEANLKNVFLWGANLSRANFDRANLTRAVLSEADFQNATFGFTSLSDVDLSEVKGLETCNHWAPSTIGIDTIYKSKENIPEIFLRDAGVPATFISSISSLIKNMRNKYYSCYIAYGGKDKKFAKRIYGSLKEKDLRVWFFPESTTGGKDVWDEIDQAIQQHDKVIAICSKKSLNRAAVEKEIERALNKEDQLKNQTGKTKQVLVPIILDTYLEQGWVHSRKQDVLNHVYIDFKGCKTTIEKYDKAFKKLMKALAAE